MGLFGGGGSKGTITSASIAQDLAKAKADRLTQYGNLNSAPSLESYINTRMAADPNAATAMRNAFLAAKGFTPSQPGYGVGAYDPNSQFSGRDARAAQQISTYNAALPGAVSGHWDTMTPDQRTTAILDTLLGTKGSQYLDPYFGGNYAPNGTLRDTLTQLKNNPSLASTAENQTLSGMQHDLLAAQKDEHIVGSGFGGIMSQLPGIALGAMTGGLGSALGFALPEPLATANSIFGAASTANDAINAFNGPKLSSPQPITSSFPQSQNFTAPQLANPSPQNGNGFMNQRPINTGFLGLQPSIFGMQPNTQTNMQPRNYGGFGGNALPGFTASQVGSGAASGLGAGLSGISHALANIPSISNFLPQSLQSLTGPISSFFPGPGSLFPNKKQQG